MLFYRSQTKIADHLSFRTINLLSERGARIMRVFRRFHITTLYINDRMVYILLLLIFHPIGMASFSGWHLPLNLPRLEECSTPKLHCHQMINQFSVCAV